MQSTTAAPAAQYRPLLRHPHRTIPCGTTSAYRHRTTAAIAASPEHIAVVCVYSTSTAEKTQLSAGYVRQMSGARPAVKPGASLWLKGLQITTAIPSPIQCSAHLSSLVIGYKQRLATAVAEAVTAQSKMEPAEQMGSGVEWPIALTPPGCEGRRRAAPWWPCK